MPFNDIVTALRLVGQFPLDPKLSFKLLADMQDLGTNDVNAFMYYESMLVICNEDKKQYIWRSPIVLNEVGLLPSNYIYPANTISDGIDYSNRVFNFFEYSTNTSSTPVNEADAIFDGTVYHLQNMDYRSTPITYRISNNEYAAPITNMTLTAAHATLNRRDVFVVNTSNQVLVITGTPAVNPQEPVVSIGSQLRVSSVFIPANATQPRGVANFLIYNENVGTPTEWAASYDGSIQATINVASVTDPSDGTVSIEADDIDSINILRFNADALVSVQGLSSIQFKIKHKTTQDYILDIVLKRSGVVVSSLSINLGDYVFDPTDISAYQVVNIPASVFNLNVSDIDFIGFNVNGGSGTIGGFFLDYIQLLYGSENPVIEGTYLGLDDTSDTTYEGKEGQVPMVNNNKTGLVLTPVVQFKDIYQENRLISYSFAWITGLIFDVIINKYIIDGILLPINVTSINERITLDVADVTNPRKDVIVVNIDETISIVKGTPAADPAEPAIDFATQLRITVIDIAANALVPTNITEELIYAENAGEPTEWTAVENTGGARIDLVDTSDPDTGTNAIKGTALQSSDSVTFTNNTLNQVANLNSFTFRLKVPFNPENIAFVITATNAGALVSSPSLRLLDGIYGIDSNDITGYRTITIPVIDFAFTNTEFDGIKIGFKTVGIENLNSIFIDNVRLIYGGESISSKNTFLDLKDTPNEYNGQAGKIIRIKTNEIGIEFVNIPSIQTTSVFVKSTGDNNTAEFANRLLPYANLDTAMKAVYDNNGNSLTNYKFIILDSGSYTITYANFGNIDVGTLHIDSGDFACTIITNASMYFGEAFVLNGKNMKFIIDVNATTIALAGTSSSMLNMSETEVYIDIKTLEVSQNSPGIITNRAIRGYPTTKVIKLDIQNLINLDTFATWANGVIVFSDGGTKLTANFGTVTNCPLIFQHIESFVTINKYINNTAINHNVADQIVNLKINSIDCTGGGDVDLYFQNGTTELLGGTLQNTFLWGQGWTYNDIANKLIGKATIHFTKDYSYIFPLYKKAAGIISNSIETNILKDLNLKITSDTQARCLSGIFRNEDTDFHGHPFIFDNTIIEFDQTDKDWFITGGLAALIQTWTRTNDVHGITFRNSCKFIGGRYLISWVGDIDFTTFKYLAIQKGFINHVEGTGISATSGLKIHEEHKREYIYDQGTDLNNKTFYINNISGSDITGEYENPAKPFETIDAAIIAYKALTIPNEGTAHHQPFVRYKVITTLSQTITEVLFRADTGSDKAPFVEIISNGDIRFENNTGTPYYPASSTNVARLAGEDFNKITIRANNIYLQGTGEIYLGSFLGLNQGLSVINIKADILSFGNSLQMISSVEGRTDDAINTAGENWSLIDVKRIITAGGTCFRSIGQHSRVNCGVIEVDTSIVAGIFVYATKGAIIDFDEIIASKDFVLFLTANTEAVAPTILHGNISGTQAILFDYIKARAVFIEYKDNALIELPCYFERTFNASSYYYLKGNRVEYTHASLTYLFAVGSDGAIDITSNIGAQIDINHLIIPNRLEEVGRAGSGFRLINCTLELGDKISEGFTNSADVAGFEARSAVANRLLEIIGDCTIISGIADGTSILSNTLQANSLNAECFIKGSLRMISGIIDESKVDIIRPSGTIKEYLKNTGIFDYNDLVTATTPIAITGGGGAVFLTNDAAGAFTNKLYPPTGVTDIWDNSTNDFDFSQLTLGSTIIFRIDLEIVLSAANQEIDLTMDIAIGGTPYTLSVDHRQYKTAGTYHYVNSFSIYMGDINTLNNPAKFAIESPNNLDVKVNGWACNIHLY